MPTERYHPLASGWLDAGPTPCLLQLKTVACVMVLVPGLLIFLLAQNQFIQGLTSGARKG